MNGKSAFVLYTLYRLIDMYIRQFFHLPAMQAHQMLMRGNVVCRFKQRHIILKAMFDDQIAIQQQL